MPQQHRIDEWVAGLDEQQLAEAAALFGTPPDPTGTRAAHALGTALGDLLAALDAIPPGPHTGPELIAAAAARTRQLLNDKDPAP